MWAVSMVGQEKALFAKNVGAFFQKIAIDLIEALIIDIFYDRR